MGMNHRFVFYMLTTGYHGSKLIQKAPVKKPLFMCFVSQIDHISGIAYGFLLYAFDSTPDNPEITVFRILIEDKLIAAVIYITNPGSKIDMAPVRRDFYRFHSITSLRLF